MILDMEESTPYQSNFSCYYDNRLINGLIV